MARSDGKGWERILGISLSEFVAGALSILIGAMTLVEAMRYDLGTARLMGPGFFPFGLGLVMIATGLGIMLVEGRRAESEKPDVPAFRSLIAIAAAIAAFALLVQRVGFAPAVAVAAFLATFAEREVRLLRSVLLAVVLAVLTVLIFSIGLGLPMRPIRW